jgi:hypothetical protein
MINILAFQANPFDQDQLRLNTEVREIQHVLLNQPYKGLIDYQLSVHPAMQAGDLQQFILEQSPQVVHFSGHGDEYGIIVENSNGKSDAIPNEALKTIFQNLSGSIQCVVLNSCYSKHQAEIISRYVPCVVGMRSKVRDDAAIMFSKSFYQALVYGKSVGEAFSLAEGSIAATGKKQSEATIIYRQGFSPSKLYLVKPPKLSAMICTDDYNTPLMDDDEENYWIQLTVTDVPSNATSVVLQYNHETVRDPFDEMLNDGTGFTFEACLGGNLQIKVNIWFMDVFKRMTQYSAAGSQYAYGFSQDLYSTLTKTYEDPTVFRNKKILEAIEEIGLY